MLAQTQKTAIKLQKLSGIQVNGKKVVADGADSSKLKAGETLLAAGVKALAVKDDKIVFAGQDYKGTFTATEAKVSSGTAPNIVSTIKGDLELYLERPENHFTINGVKINVAADAKHTFTTGKDGGATIDLVFNNNNPGGVDNDKLTITEKDSGWFTTGLTLNNITPEAGSSLKFGEWNDFDLPNQCYVNIDFV